MERKNLNWKAIAGGTALFAGGFILLPNEAIFFCILAGGMIGFFDSFSSYEPDTVNALQIVIFISTMFFVWWSIWWSMAEGSFWMMIFWGVLATALSVPFILLTVGSMLLIMDGFFEAA